MAKRILKKVDVTHISLVNRGANQKTIIFKSADNINPELKVVPITKIDEDQHIVYGIVYSPNDEDAQGDIATAEVIKDMAYRFMEKGQTNNVDKQHNFQSEEGFIAESWLTKENDSVFPNANIGSWGVAIKVAKQETWELIKSGAIAGLSLAGVAVVEEIEKSNSLQLTIKTKIAEWIGAELKNYDVQKAGKVLSTANAKIITDAINALQALLALQKNEIIKEAEQMSQDEFQAELAKAIKPIMDEITVLKAANEKMLEQIESNHNNLNERVSIVEKSTLGTAQLKDIEKSTEPANIWV